jgi:nucleotide-binding universal stress UspA family protein
MFERILVPLDGSKVGEAAIPVIKRLLTRRSSSSKVDIYLLAVITLLRHWVVVGEASAPVSYTEEELSLIKDRVQNYLEKTAESIDGSGVTIHCMVVTGNASEEILKAAGEIDADLIAMSTHGRSGLRRMAFGSITDKILRGASVPVLMVRAPEGTANQ